MSSKSIGDYKHNYHWLSEKQISNLSSLLANLVNHKPDEVVIVGDLLDNWVCPIDITPPSMSDILHAAHNRPIIDGLNAVMNAGVKVIFVGGNHDQLVTAADLHEVMPRLTVGEGWRNDSIYRDGRIHAEHGSAQGMFNAPDPQNDPRLELPVGYFLTRIITTRAARTGETDRKWMSYFDDVMDVVSSSKHLATAVFNALLEEARIPDSASVALPGDTSITVQDMKARYADVYEQWCASHKGFGAGIRGILAEFHYLDDMADQLCKRGDVTVVVLGHSHNPEFDKDKWFVKDRIYANSGAWCEKQDSGTFVEVQSTDKEHVVRVREWNGKEAKTLHEDSVGR
jgi:UDP-2,3-diacylglucosamine pyrophosphatase LpxH